MKKMMRPMLMAAGAVGMASGLSACVASFDPQTDASSPLAPRVQAMVDAHRTYPRWEDFPRSSEPVPPPAQVAQQVNTLRATGGALANEVSTLQWTNGDPAALEREVAARVSAVPVSPDAARTAAELDVYAQALRDRAKAPPPIGRTSTPPPQTAPQ